MIGPNGCSALNPFWFGSHLQGGEVGIVPDFNLEMPSKLVTKICYIVIGFYESFAFAPCSKLLKSIKLILIQ